MPNLRRFAMCRARLQQPAFSSSRFSSTYSFGSGAPAVTGGPPPCIFSARTVATRTATLGWRPEARHLMSTNFSAPMSAPNPASVTTKPSEPTSLRAILSATTLLLPCAMFANGPACTNTGVSSIVCSSVGMMVSFMSTVRAPPTPRSSAVMGLPSLERATTMSPRRRRMSAREVVRARTAMISLATVMSNCVTRSFPFSVALCPIVIFLRYLSLVSTTLLKVIVLASMSSRANLLCSSSVRLAGPSFSMPSLRSLSSITGAKAALPPTSRR
mmetsp:Transcript_13111/g.52286  ORF Transcript_13111/g.52286 Transcript_13111/m.52286 type:complete len:272 (+) Transcript_13111:631-1446(+)